MYMYVLYVDYSTTVVHTCEHAVAHRRLIAILNGAFYFLHHGFIFRQPNRRLHIKTTIINCGTVLAPQHSLRLVYAAQLSGVRSLRRVTRGG